jgi:pentose-5-phosphate-3-epimerase
MSWGAWVQRAEIEPSIYAADFPNLGAQLETLLAACVRVFHYDVGDGHFVDPITIGPIVLESIAPIVERGGAALDCRLMVAEPEKRFEQIKAAGGASVTFHVEACADPPAVSLQVDGGVSAENIRDAHDAGADLLVAGTSVFWQDDLGAAYRRLRSCLEAINNSTPVRFS